MCKRLGRILQKREAYEQAHQLNATQDLQKGTGNTAFQKEKEEFLKSLGLSSGAV